MKSKGKLIRIRNVQLVCPPKHTNAAVFPLLTENTVGAQHIELFYTEIQPGGGAEEDTHPNSEHGYFIISGRGIAKVEDEEFIVEPSDCLWIPMGARHEIKSIGGETIRLVVFMAPPRQKEGQVKVKF